MRILKQHSAFKFFQYFTVFTMSSKYLPDFSLLWFTTFIISWVYTKQPKILNYCQKPYWRMWKNVLWSDETKILGLGTNRYIWQKLNKAYHHERTILTLKHGGGSSKLWGCFSIAEPGKLWVRVEGKKDWVKYSALLEKSVFQSTRDLRLLRRLIVHQDNDPKSYISMVEN